MKAVKFWALLLLVVAAIAGIESCKSCNKKDDNTVKPADTAQANLSNSGTLTLPHADTTLIPLLASVIDEAFDASSKKDYKRFANCIIYRGPDSLRYFTDVFTYNTPYEKQLVKITSDAFNKWSKDVESRDYNRIYDVPLPDGSSMPFLEVIFIGPKNTHRKFFGFLPVGQEFKIAEVTSTL